MDGGIGGDADTESKCDGHWRISQDFARQNGDVELIDTPNHSPQKQQQQRRPKKGKTDTLISIAGGDDAFLSKTVHHDLVQNAAVPNMRDDAQWIDVWLFASDYTFNLSNVRNNCRDDTFPMLMMQLAHILVRNHQWSKKAHAKLRVMLMVDNQWDHRDRDNFDAMLQQLRLTELEVQVLKVFIRWKCAFKSVSISDFDIKLIGFVTVQEPENYSKPQWRSIIEEKRRGTNLKKVWLDIGSVHKVWCWTGVHFGVQYYNSLNSMIKSLSGETYFTFIALPEFPPIVEMDEEMNSRLNLMYYQSLYVLLRGLPPTALVATGEMDPVISIDL